MLLLVFCFVAGIATVALNELWKTWHRGYISAMTFENLFWFVIAGGVLVVLGAVVLIFVRKAGTKGAEELSV